MRQSQIIRQAFSVTILLSCWINYLHYSSCGILSYHMLSKGTLWEYVIAMSSNVSSSLINSRGGVHTTKLIFPLRFVQREHDNSPRIMEFSDNVMLHDDHGVQCQVTCAVYKRYNSWEFKLTINLRSKGLVWW